MIQQKIIILVLANLVLINGQFSRDINTQIDKTPSFLRHGDRSFKARTYQEPPSRDSKINKEDDQDIIKYGFKTVMDMARGRKNNWIERVVPLFILPFLIQSAVVPFIVQSIKLLVLKSLLVGKTALIFFALGMLKNVGKTQRSSVPYYLKEIPAYERPDDIMFPHYITDQAHPTVGVEKSGSAHNLIQNNN